MARIRSIKPEFFTSEVVSALPISTRLTFIGLWTHVDDNGVAVDNEKLIAAAIWPLEDDPLETLRSLSGDLQRLSTAGLIVRYEVSGRRFLYVSGWDEHQKVSHPSKPRYPRPGSLDAPPPSRQNASLQKPSGDTPEDLPKPPEILAPEQGAGSREQGARSRERASAPATRQRAANATRIPEDFTLTEELKLWAKEHAPDVVIAVETAQFVDHWIAASGTNSVKKNWTAAWRTWMRNSQKWSTERSSRPALSVVGRSSGANRHIDQTRRIDNPFADGRNATYASKIAGGAQ